MRKLLTALNQPVKPSRVWVVLLTSTLNALGNSARHKRISNLEKRIVKLESAAKVERKTRGQRQ